MLACMSGDSIVTVYNIENNQLEIDVVECCQYYIIICRNWNVLYVYYNYTGPVLGVLITEDTYTSRN